mgnify:CR=1 FL=1
MIKVDDKKIVVWGKKLGNFCNLSPKSHFQILESTDGKEDRGTGDDFVERPGEKLEPKLFPFYFFYKYLKKR